jgi:DNA-binding NarL/FixJ family response regulator
MEKIKIIVVDDHQIFRTGLILLLNEIEYIEIVGEASDGEELLRLLCTVNADIIFMDIKMPKLNGIESTKKVTEKYPETKVIALSMHDDEKYLDSMLMAGAKGFLSKKVGLDDLEKAINLVTKGKNYFSEDLLSILAQKVNPVTGDQDEKVKLTKREHETLQLICKGYSNQEIAEKLFISQRTVESHRANLLEKTNSKNSINLVIYAIRNNLYEI